MSAKRKKKKSQQHVPHASLELPSWEQGFVVHSKRHTARANLVMILDVLALLFLPLATASLSPFADALGQRDYLTIVAMFGLLLVLTLLRQILWYLIVSKHTHFWGRATCRAGKAGLWGVFCLWWYALSDTNLFFVILGWWICGIPFLCFMWLQRKWEHHGAKVIKQNFKLFGLKRLPVGSHRQKLGSLQLLELPEGSPPGDHSARTTVTRKPTVYLGNKMMDHLTSHQLSAVIAHELGHSISTEGIGFQIGRWGWRLFGLPVTLWLSKWIPASAIPWLPDGSVLQFLTVTIVVWLFTTWIAKVLDRQIEIRADLFALKLATGAQDLVDGMEKMALKTLYNVFPNILDRLLLVSHPCVIWRMKVIKAAWELSRK